MNNSTKKFFMLVCCALSFLMTGCNALDKNVVVHDELFTYEVSYDRCYMVILDVIASKTDGWKLLDTDKPKGVIRARVDSFMRDDIATVIVKRLDKRKSSVELAPDSQTMKGVDQILKEIDKAMLLKY